MQKNQIFDAIEYKDIKEIIYNSAEKFSTQTAFVIKHKQGKEVEYENITYKKFLEDINSFGTALYEMGFKGKRIAVIGKNRYEWVLAHISNLMRSNCFSTIR